MLARYAVLPSPLPISDLRELLFCKINYQLNCSESTLLQVFILGNLKPIGINTYEKQGEGCQLWLTRYYKRVSPAADRLSALRFIPPSRDEKSVTATPLDSTLTNRDVCNSFRIRSYAKWRVSPALSSPFWSAFIRFSAPLRGKPALFSIFTFPISAPSALLPQAWL
jgi:hypothetical protein